MGEYNKYISKKNRIMNILNNKKVNKIILNYLKENDIDINDSKVLYLVKMIKKMLFNYMMFGEEFSIELLNSNPMYLYNAFIEEKAIEVRNNVNNLFNNTPNVNEFILSSVNPITVCINSSEKKHKLQKTS